ncbi:unnamed protein product [Moneuplotes crassus]|uniref:Uncharacterized protein n=1 Tax=Euplotes crassus TaxID=5936 RepID=A0AAD2D1D2_EUPCR|nr:unnamed protein product [Moneuplotes crassus]
MNPLITKKKGKGCGSGNRSNMKGSALKNISFISDAKEDLQKFNFSSKGNSSKRKSKKNLDMTNTYQIIKMNRSQLLDKIEQNTSYQAMEFDNYSMFQKPKPTQEYKTHDGRKVNEQRSLKRLKQNSMREFTNTLTRVKSKQLTQRSKAQPRHSSSNQNLTKMNRTHTKVFLDNHIISPSSKRRNKKTIQKSQGHLKKRYAPMQVKKNKENSLEFYPAVSKTNANSKNKIRVDYKKALQELKNQARRNNSKSTDRKPKVKVTSKMVKQPRNKSPEERNQINKNNLKAFNNWNIVNKNLPDVKHPNLDVNTTSSILKMIKGLQRGIAKQSIHCRARTSEIGSKNIKKNQRKCDPRAPDEQRIDRNTGTPRKSSCRSQKRSYGRK